MAEQEQHPPGRPAGAAPVARPGYRGRIERIFEHADDVRSLFIRTLGAAVPRYSPGMFISIALPLAAESRVRPYSIASSPEDPEPFEVVLDRVPGGAGAAWLFERTPGDELDFTGTYGTFTLSAAPDAELVFIAAGTAIAPIRPMIRRALAGPVTRSMHLLYGADRPDHLLYRSELADLAAMNQRLQVTTIVVDGGSAALYARLAEEAHQRWVAADNDRSRHCYICGVGPGVIELRDLLRGAGYERRAVHYEKW